jgi:hypothetical protein
MSRGPIPDKPRDRPTVPEVVEMAKRYYAKPENSVGGSLHSVLEDENTEDISVEGAREFAVERGDADGVELADALLAMTRTQRRNVRLRI